MPPVGKVRVSALPKQIVPKALFGPVDICPEWDDYPIAQLLKVSHLIKQQNKSHCTIDSSPIIIYYLSITSIIITMNFAIFHLVVVVSTARDSVAWSV